MHSRTLPCLIVIVFAVSTTPAGATNLLTNGSFEDGLTGWENNSKYFDGVGGAPISWGISIVDDGSGHNSAVFLDGDGGSNYSLRLVQEVTVDNAENFHLAFDWAVQKKEYRWGANRIRMIFRDAQDQAVGAVVAWDAGNPAHDVDYYQGNLSDDAFWGQYYYREDTLPWETIDLWTSEALPGMNAGDVTSVWVEIAIQNDAGYGGEMLADHFVLEATGQGTIPEPATLLAGLAGLAGLRRYVRRR